jgi:SH3-like domain-containing protein
VVTTLAEGTPVEILDEPVPAQGRSWQRVRNGDHEGWVVAVVVQHR